MTVTYRYIKAFLLDETGPTATEYAVLLALIAIVCVAAIAALGGLLPGIYQHATDELAIVPGTE